MCGLIGIIGKNIEQELLDGLRILQYRGYDSYGICTATDGLLNVRKELHHITENASFNLQGNIGLGHTRWATHGKVSLANTHPIWRDNIAVVLNGVIENYLDIQRLFPDFLWDGETDVECVLPLFLESRYIDIEMLKSTMHNLAGSFALVVLNAKTEEVYFMRRGTSPLAVGISQHKKIIGSDIKLFEGFDKIIDIQDMQCGIITREHFILYPNNPVYTMRSHVEEQVEKSRKTWFETEFMQQPRILQDAMKTRTEFPSIFLNDVLFTGCGSSYLVATIASYWMREIANVRAYASLPAELPHGYQCLVALSQSGETADVLRALQYSDSHFKVGVINNTRGTMSKYVDYIIPVLAKSEISVASTKATTAQMLSLLRWAAALGDTEITVSVQEMIRLMEDFIQTRLSEVSEIAKLCANKSSLFILGRGILFPIAQEGALKIKELSYIHAEGMHIAELKHGPLAVIDESSIVICLTQGNSPCVAEIMARGGQVIVFTEEPEHFPGAITIQMRRIDPMLAPFLYILPMQWLAYELAQIRGNNVDMPRNLAKSVTVL